MNNKMQVLGGIILAGGISMIGLVDWGYLYNGAVSVYYEKIVSPYYKAKAAQKRSSMEASNKESNRKSVVILNTGSTYYCGQAGIAKTRDYLNNLLADGWSVESSETSTFAGIRGNTCSFSYYVMKK